MISQEILKQARGEEKAELVLKNTRIIDVFNEILYDDDIAISDGIILGTGDYEGKREIDLEGKLLSPAFIDGHLHLESSMVRVEEFARHIIPLGTTTIVADPHEIANVAGLKGIKYLLESGLKLPWNFHLMLPSCVPATEFESSGAILNAADLEKLIDEEGIFGLGEVMNYVGVINGDRSIWEKIELTKELFRDGHAPGLLGKDLNTYLLAGIKADHETTTAKEALEKVRKGLYIMIREGSVTRDLVNLLPAINDSNLSRFLFATDDRHPEDLIDEGHINFLIKKAINNGMEALRAIKLATINAARALGFDNLGAIAPGYRADLLIIDNLSDLNILQVYKDGKLVAENGELNLVINKEKDANRSEYNKIYDSVKIGSLNKRDFILPGGKNYKVIGLNNNSIITKKLSLNLAEDEDLNNELMIDKDLAKIAVVERHKKTGNTGLALIKGTGLKKGAVATSVGHDSHNILVIGLNEADMYKAVKEIERLKGGIVLVKDGAVSARLALAIAGLISDKSLKEVSDDLKELKKKSRELGISLKNPFMTLAFMALPVIPSLKITDKGLFDVEEFKHVSVLNNF